MAEADQHVNAALEQDALLVWILSFRERESSSLQLLGLLTNPDSENRPRGKATSMCANTSHVSSQPQRRRSFGALSPLAARAPSRPSTPSFAVQSAGVVRLKLHRTEIIATWWWEWEVFACRKAEKRRIRKVEGYLGFRVLFFLVVGGRVGPSSPHPSLLTSPDTHHRPQRAPWNAIVTAFARSSRSTKAMELATALHHSAQRPRMRVLEEPGGEDAPLAQNTSPPGTWLEHV